MLTDILTLQVFEKVATLRSFTRAATALKFSQVMVSKRIAKLEAAVGTLLLDRTTRHVSLTPDGHKVLAAVTRILSTLDREWHAVTAQETLTGTLRFVAPPFFSRYHIVPYLGEFLDRHPGLTFDMILTENEVDLLKDGIHFEIRIGPLQESVYDQRILFENPKIICAAPSYLDRYGTPVHPKELKSHNCLIFGENHYWTLVDQFGHREILELSGNIRCNNGELIKELVLAGLGITLKSQQDIYNELRSGALMPLFPDYRIDNPTMVVARYPKCLLSETHIQTFLDFLIEKYQRP